MSLSIEQLRAAMDSNTRKSGNKSGPNNYFPFWNMPLDGQCTIRFLPDKDKSNVFGFFRPKWTHSLTINGRNRKVVCPETYGKGMECPICNASQTFYKAEDKTNGSRYWRRPQYITQALIEESSVPLQDGEESPVGQVKLVALSPSVYKMVKAGCDDDLEELPFDYENGTDFIIKKTKNGEYADYTLSKFARRERALDPSVVMEIEEKLFDLSTVLPKEVPVEELDKMLEADLTGAEYKDPGTNQRQAEKDETRSKIQSLVDSNRDNDDDDDDQGSVPVRVEPAAEKVEESSSEAGDTTDDEVDAILAKIRNR